MEIESELDMSLQADPNFQDITASKYSIEDMQKMKANILECLPDERWNPTVLTFLREFITAAQSILENPELQLQVEPLCSYLAYVSLNNVEMVKFLPSLIAASVVFLAMFIIQPEKRSWCSRLQNCTGYQAAELKECVLQLLSSKQKIAVTILARFIGIPRRVEESATVANIPASYFD
ncbi:cyclin-A3-3-like [Silene latifolia]|uniref:cyclin-A3-3-like n=1 Tax=Silene latifolia TaxID=37657 RepID=UPI003D778B2D